MPGQEAGEAGSPELSVTEASDARLTIDIKPQKSRRKAASVSEDDSAPSSAEIKVVHKAPPPANLHGILKQRTMSESEVSESAEDFFFSGNSGEDLQSPRSGDDNDPLSSSSSSFTKRRSVSFNSYVDQASFKSGAAPCKMHMALKSKRKKQKKREGRLRQRSGSECSDSSGTEWLSHSEDEALVEEAAEEGDATPAAKLPPAKPVEVPTPPAAAGKKKNKKRNRRSKNKKAGAGEAESSDLEHAASEGEKSGERDDAVEAAQTPESHDINERTNGSADADAQSVLTNGQMKEEANQEMSEETPVSKHTQDLDAIKNEKNKKIVSDIKSKLAAGAGDMGDQDSDDDGEGEESSSNTIGGGDHDSAQSNGVKEKSDVETVLSWEDGPKMPEHVTECAVKLENAFMFDLDVD